MSKRGIMKGFPKDAVSQFSAITGINIAEQKIFEGRTFSISKRYTIGASETFDIVIDPTGVTSEYLVFLPISFKAFGAGPINIDMYFGTVSAEDGTLWQSTNRDNTSAITTPVTVRLKPTVTNPGTKLPPEFTIFSNGTAAVAVAGGETREGLIFLARKDGKYMFRITNTEATAAFFHMAATWYEVDPV